MQSHSYLEQRQNCDNRIKRIPPTFLKRPSLEFLITRKFEDDEEDDILNKDKITLSGIPNERNNENIVKDMLEILSLHKWKSRSVSLEIRCGKITGYGAKVLCSNIVKYMVDLEYLTLDFSDCLVSDKGLEALGFIISRCLLRIKKLVLIFYCCFAITDKGAELLYRGLSTNFSFLQGLTLDFSFTHISDKAVYFLTTRLLSHLLVLTQLQLSFFHCKGITDKGLENLAYVIPRSLPKLKSLFLDFSHCPISDQGLKALGIAIAKQSVQLNQMSLFFDWCIEITEGGVEDFVRRISKTLNHLENLTLNVFRSKASKDYYTKLFKLVSFIPQVSIR